MELLTTSIISGIAIGSIYGLIGLSLCSIFNASRVVNFAQGENAMLGALAGSVFVYTGDWPLYVSIPAIVGIPVVLAIVFHFLVAEPLVRAKAHHLVTVFALVGASMTVSGGMGALTHFRYFTTRLLLGAEAYKLGIFNIAPQYLLIISATVVLALLYWLFLHKTGVGLAFRATGIDDDAASLMGINLGRIRLLSWCIGGFICGVAGFFVAPLIMPSATMGTPLLVNGFIAAVFGGFGEPLAALGGGIVLGMFGSLFSSYVSAGNAEIFMLVAMLIVLAVRPRGLMYR